MNYRLGPAHSSSLYALVPTSIPHCCRICACCNVECRRQCSQPVCPMWVRARVCVCVCVCDSALHVGHSCRPGAVLFSNIVAFEVQASDMDGSVNGGGCKDFFGEIVS